MALAVRRRDPARPVVRWGRQRYGPAKPPEIEMHHPDRCETMTDLRALIDRLDAELVALLAQRQACIDRAITLKRAQGLPARIPARVTEVLEKVRATAEAEGLDPILADALWRQMIDWAIAREARVLGDET